MKVKFWYEDTGLFRIYYKGVGEHRGQIVCQQASIGDTWEWYACSKDGEPSHSITKPNIM